MSLLWSRVFQFEKSFKDSHGLGSFSSDLSSSPCCYVALASVRRTETLSRSDVYLSTPLLQPSSLLLPVTIVLVVQQTHHPNNRDCFNVSVTWMLVCFSQSLGLTLCSTVAGVGHFQRKTYTSMIIFYTLSPVSAFSMHSHSQPSDSSPLVPVRSKPNVDCGAFVWLSPSSPVSRLNRWSYSSVSECHRWLWTPRAKVE